MTVGLEYRLLLFCALLVSHSFDGQNSLEQNRKDVLLTSYFNKKVDKNFVQATIVLPGFNLKHLYQCLTDSGKGKFIAFFADSVNFRDVKSIPKKNESGEQTDIYFKRGPLELSQATNIPLYYEFILVGIKIKNQWVVKQLKISFYEEESLEKSKENYFCRLAKWNFFKEGSAEINSEFWNSFFFDKVRSQVEVNRERIQEFQKAAETAKDTIMRNFYLYKINSFYEEDARNSEFIGMYELEAKDLELKRESENKNWKSGFIENRLIPFYNPISKNEIKAFVKLNGSEYLVIFPNDKANVLCPIMVEFSNGEKKLIYFVAVQQKSGNYIFYRWNYFQPISSKFGNGYGGEVHDHLNILTKWNFAFSSLNDSKFWSEYILVKENGKYKFLTSVQK